VNSCAFCGRANDDGSQFCIDCGKSLQPSSAARAISTAAVANLTQIAAPPFTPVSAPAPARPLAAGVASCPHCGTPGDAAEAPAWSSGAGAYQPRRATHQVVVLGATGEVAQTHVIDRGELVIGRSGGDVRFADDVYMSPIHAHLAARDGGVWVRDLGSRNGTWVFIDGPCRLQDGDTVLVGSQLLRFRRLGYPGPHPPEADATRRLGSTTPGADVAVLMQLRGDGSHRDVFHLTPGRRVVLGREEGDWVFPYDQTMSGRHAEIRSEDSEFVLADAGSRNGVAVAVRGDREVRAGQRVLVGDQVLRVEPA
jgi:pSer/pThr/pTyr-binding forkhead associated (FHA) protein